MAWDKSSNQMTVLKEKKANGLLTESEEKELDDMIRSEIEFFRGGWKKDGGAARNLSNSDDAAQIALIRQGSVGELGKEIDKNSPSKPRIQGQPDMAKAWLDVNSKNTDLQTSLKEKTDLIAQLKQEKQQVRKAATELLKKSAPDSYDGLPDSPDAQIPDNLPQDEQQMLEALKQELGQRLDEIEDFKKAVEEAKKEFEQLNLQLTKKDTEAQSMTEEVAGLKEQIGQLQTDLESSKSTLSTTQNQLETLQKLQQDDKTNFETTVEDFKKQIGHHDQKMQELSASLAAEKQTIIELRQELEKSNAEKAEQQKGMNSTVDEKQRELERIQAELKAMLEEKQKELEKVQAEKKQELEDAEQNKKKELEKAEVDKKQALEKAEAEFEKVEAERKQQLEKAEAEKEEKLRGLNAILDEQKKEFDKQQEENQQKFDKLQKDSSEQISSLQAQLEKNAQHLAQMTSSHEDATQQREKTEKNIILELQEQLKKMTEQHNQLKETNEKVTEQFSQLKDSSTKQIELLNTRDKKKTESMKKLGIEFEEYKDKTTKEIENLKNSEKVKNEKIGELEENLKQLIEKNNEKEKEIQTQKEQIEKAKKTEEADKKALFQYADETRLLQDQVVSLKNQMAQAAKADDKLEALQALQKKIDSLENQNRELTKTQKTLEAEDTRMKALVTEHEGTIQSSKATIAGLQQQLEQMKAAQTKQAEATKQETEVLKGNHKKQLDDVQDKNSTLTKEIQELKTQLAAATNGKGKPAGKDGVCPNCEILEKMINGRLIKWTKMCEEASAQRN